MRKIDSIDAAEKRSNSPGNRNVLHGFGEKDFKEQLSY
jgi:hypothetical protein